MQRFVVPLRLPRDRRRHSEKRIVRIDRPQRPDLLHVIRASARNAARHKNAPQRLEIPQPLQAELLHQRPRVEIQPRRLNVRGDAQFHHFVHRLATHEIAVRDARTRRANRQRAPHLLIRLEQPMHRAVAHRMRRELQPALHRRLHHRQQPLLRNEPQPAIRRVLDPVNLTHAPRLPHERAAREHPAVEKHFDADDLQQRVRLAQRMLRHRANAFLNVRQRPEIIDVMRDRHPHRQLAALQQFLIPRNRSRISRPITHRRDAHRIVIFVQLDPAP